jgi:hypothetical protein
VKVQMSCVKVKSFRKIRGKYMTRAGRTRAIYSLIGLRSGEAAHGAPFSGAPFFISSD